MNPQQAGVRRVFWIFANLFALTWLGLPGWAADNQKPAGAEKKPNYPARPDTKNVKIIPEAWKTLGNKTIAPHELDQLLIKELNADKLQTAPRTTDEQFIRRVTLDLTGKLPLPADVEEFVKDADPAKRSKLIDRLLASDDYARHWARYWRETVVARATSERVKRGFQMPQRFEDWMFTQLKANHSWGQIAHDIIAATGELHYLPSPPGPSPDAARGERGEGNGEAFLLLSHEGPDGANERAAEVSRVFLGIQIQCAQCHDHPSDIWKRNQFHEMAAFFARTRERPVRNPDPSAQMKQIGIALVSLPRGEHQMPAKDDPKKTTTIQPKFLTGQTIKEGLDDFDRRKALANFITSKDNYWFSAAFVNRVWGELVGQGFYQPVDNMGPLQESTYPNVLLHLAGSFRASNYDVKGLFRLVMNSQAYQRQIRLGDQANEHLHFAGIYPTRLPADALWESLVGALGMFPAPPVGPQGMGPGGGRFAGRFGLEAVFRDTFGFDPSTKSDEVEGSVPQALMLMNNPAINNRMKAAGGTNLSKILNSYTDDSEAIKMLYLRTLARKPTVRELETCLAFIHEVGKRNDAFEDIQWTLINSAEFQSKR
jgi:hypothetical protein